jgi:AbrB family looped-hinge helix DNA binding protein
MSEAGSITTIGKKGQVVIPKRLRDALKVTPRTKFVVFGKGDMIVLKRLSLPDLGREWDELLRAVDRKGLTLSEEDVRREVRAARRRPASK